MKKIIIAGAFLLSVAAIHATTQNDAKLRSDRAGYYSVYNDTTPSDTTKDTANPQLAWNIIRDTVPSDTTRDTTNPHLAWNIVRDTVPSDTTKPDSTRTLAFNFAK